MVKTLTRESSTCGMFGPQVKFWSLLVPVLGLSLSWAQTCVGGGAEERGLLQAAEVPVAQRVVLDPAQAEAARQGRLGWKVTGRGALSGTMVPIQWRGLGRAEGALGTWVMPAGAPRMVLGETAEPFVGRLGAVRDPASGQVDLAEGGRLVLRYNYNTVEPGDVLARVAEGNRIYARARSDYIHPLCGPSGEVLTCDWAVDHPHHRGIYWAWPEVEFGSERGDLHALQRVFARPTGRLELESGPVFGEIRAENLWRWEDRRPVVREWAILRAYPATPRGRVVDLRFELVALEDGVTVARRDTRHYGGLNLRLATPGSQKIQVHTDPLGASPRRAWSDLSGVFSGTTASGLTVMQHAGNPEHPGDWVQYPELSWVQPTFPTAGTRYPLSRERPLVLRYRLWIHPGGTPDAAELARFWDAWHAAASPSLESGVFD
ncbi:MAG TPA: PmoA family protein [Verrucomicrobiota bacterium]|nr:PmoA family protein [Verrucomicrobiota bacterium]HNU52386.1 PmoA family protein [Verrucomicrobiota bacterium]